MRTFPSMRPGAMVLAGAVAIAGCQRGPQLDSSTVPLSPGAITIRAPRAIDGRGNLLTDVRIVVEGSKIVRVEKWTPGPAPTYDFAGLTALPGLIDVHDHIGWYFNKAGRYHSGNDGETPADVMRGAFANMRATLMSGVTTIQSPGAASDAALRDSSASGSVPGPRIATSLGQVSGGTPDRLRELVRQRKAQGADLVKIFASGSIRDGGQQTMTQEQLEAACGEAKLIGIRTMVHAHSSESMRAAALAGCDQIEHGIFATQAVLDLMAQRGVYFSPQCGLVFHNYLENKARFLGISNYNEEGFAAMERAVPLAIQGFRDAIRTRGLKVVFGTDAVAGAHGRNIEELFCRVKSAGQTPMAAIVSATSLSAESMKMGETIGTLAPGYEADIIAVTGDPLEDIDAMRRVVFVMKAGKVYRNDRSPR